MLADETDGEVSVEGPLAMTAEQLEVFDYLLTHTWTETGDHFGILSHAALQTCVVRTALGYHWAPGVIRGGRLHYLSFESEQRISQLEEPRLERLVESLSSNTQSDELENHVIEAAAYRMAQEIGMKLAEKRTQAMGTLLSQDVKECICKTSQQLYENIPVERRKDITEYAERLSQALEAKLQQWFASSAQMDTNLQQ